MKRCHPDDEKLIGDGDLIEAFYKAGRAERAQEKYRHIAAEAVDLGKHALRAKVGKNTEFSSRNDGIGNYRSNIANSFNSSKVHIMGTLILSVVVSVIATCVLRKLSAAQLRLRVSSCFTLRMCIAEEMCLL